MGELSEFYHEQKERFNNIRDARKDRFETELLPLIEKRCIVTIGKNGNYIIDTCCGIIDYFPKSQKLLFRKSNRWIENGYRWLEDNLKAL